MITFGYKTPWSGIVRALASLGLGILAVTYPGDVIPLLVKIFAVLLGLYGFGMLIFAFVNREMMADAAKTEEQTDATVVTVDETKEDKPQA